MKILVVEGNDLVTKIYKRLFREKNYQVDFVKNESDSFEKAGQYDYIVFGNPQAASDRISIEERVRKLAPPQKVLFMPPFLDFKNEQNELMKGTKEIIEKPLGIITLIAQIELMH